MNKTQAIKYLDAGVADDEPVFVVNGDYLLYPQYNLAKMAQEWLDDPKAKDWIFKNAAILLSTDKGTVEVRRHWVRIVQNWLAEQEAKG